VRQLPQAADLAKSLPGAYVRARSLRAFLLWPMVSSTTGVRVFAPWQRLPNVHCKISGVIAYGDPSRWPGNDVAPVAEDLRPTSKRSFQSFGWQRVVWGTTFPFASLTRGYGVETGHRPSDARAGDSELDALAHGTRGASTVELTENALMSTAQSLQQAWPTPKRPIPIVMIVRAGIVNDAHLPAYRKAGFRSSDVLTRPQISAARRTAERWDIAASGRVW